MNYSRIYNNLIEIAQTRFGPISSYTEIHHIVPRCLGGDDSEGNLITLTPEEHYLAHLLLMKIYPDNEKLVYAAFMMTVGTKRNNKLYGWLKRERFKNPMPEGTRLKIKEKRALQVMQPRSEETKAKMRGPNPKKGRKGPSNGFYGKKHTEEVLNILRIKCPRHGVKRSPESIEKQKASWTDKRREEHSYRLTERNKNQSESHRQATVKSNKQRGIEKQRIKMRSNLSMYQFIFDHIQAGQEVKDIAKQIGAEYALVWKIKNTWDYYYPIFTEVCNEQ